MRCRLHRAGWRLWDRLPHDRTHREAWNSALESAEEELRNHYAKGQLVCREDVIRRIRLLMDPEPF